MSDQAKIQQQAADLLLRRDEADWSSEDEVLLEAWLNESMAHRAAFWRLEHGWKRADRLRSLYSPNAILTPSRFSVRQKVLFATAASIMAATVASFTFWSNTPVIERSYATQIGQRSSVMLPDGSVVDLNTNSRIRAEFAWNDRQVWLDRGEAYFDIAHDARHPFTVHTGMREISVLGTKFSVRREIGKITVSVVDGRVRVDGGNGKTSDVPSAVLTRGNIAIAEGTSTLIMGRDLTRIEKQLAWRKGMLIFDGITLADAATEFNRYNQQKIEISDDATAQIRIGGTFQVNNIAVFANLLSGAYRLHVDVKPDKIKISRL